MARRNAEKRTNIISFIKANDIEVNDFAEIPLVARKNVSGIIKTLEVGAYSPWDSALWNVGLWLRK